jgi:hypothetical protein
MISFGVETKQKKDDISIIERRWWDQYVLGSRD